MTSPEPTAPTSPMTDEERAALRAKLVDLHRNMTCDCCGRSNKTHPVIGVAASGCVPMSFAWCQMCLTVWAEPEMVLRYLRDDVANGDKSALRPEIFDMSTFKDGVYIKFDEWWDKCPRRQ